MITAEAIAIEKVASSNENYAVGPEVVNIQSYGPGTGALNVSIAKHEKEAYDRSKANAKLARANRLLSLKHGRDFRRLQKVAAKATEYMVHASSIGDHIDVARYADDLEKALNELWDLRRERDTNWQAIINHFQGLIALFFKENRAEMLEVHQCQAINKIAQDYIGTSTKTVDDLSEVIRLIEDAGFDPYAAISKPDK